MFFFTDCAGRLAPPRALPLTGLPIHRSTREVNAFIRRLIEDETRRKAKIDNRGGGALAPIAEHPHLTGKGEA
jgi:hypothetical protein